MKLTQEQQDMLDGKYGEGTAYAMKIQVAIGESFDAPRMVPITRAHVVLSQRGNGRSRPGGTWAGNCLRRIFRYGH